MANTLSRRDKKEMKERLSELSLELKEAVMSLTPVAVEYATSSNAYNEVKRALDKKDDERNKSRLLAVSIDLNNAKQRYDQSGAYIKEILDKYSALYTKLLGLVGNGEAKKLTAAKERLMKDYDILREQCKDAYMAVIKPDFTDEQDSEDALTPEELQALSAQQKPDEQKPDEQKPGEQKPEAQTPVEQKPGEQKPEAQTPVEQKPVDSPPRKFDTEAGITRVNVAPVTLDIAPIVERAVNAAIARLNMGMEKKIDEYVANLQLPAPTVLPVAAPAKPAEEQAQPSPLLSNANLALVSQLSEEENSIHQQLKSLCSSVGELIEQLTELTTVYYNLSQKQKELADLQRTTNDMQRTTMREQQGIQVNQRVIAQDQASLTEEQAVISEKQKANLEKQKFLIAEQENIVSSQQSLTETQSALQEAVKAVAQTQKEILQAQSSIIQANNKNLENGKAIVEKQNEVAELQKQSLAKQRQLLKDQKSFGERLDKKYKADS